MKRSYQPNTVKDNKQGYPYPTFFLGGVFVFSGLGILVPLLLLSHNGQFSLSLFLIVLILMYAATHLSIGSFKNKPDLLDLTFWMFVYVWMGIAPFVQIFYQSFPWPGIYSETVRIQGVTTVLIGLIAYDLGRLISYVKVKKQVLTVVKLKEIQITRKKFYYLTILSLMVSWAVVLKSGGIHLLFSSRNLAFSMLGSQTKALIYSHLITVPVFIILLIGIATWSALKASSRRRYVLNSFMVVLIFSNILLSNPIYNARFWFGSVAVTVGMMLSRWRKGSYFTWVVGLLIILLLVFPYAAMFRIKTVHNSFITHSVISTLQTGDYDAFQQLLNTILYVKSQGYVYGHQLLGALLFWIPRSIWASKPMGTGQFVGQFLGYTYTNFSSPLWAEGFINFGEVGVILFLGLYGYASYMLSYFYRLSLTMGIGTRLRVLYPFIAAYQFYFLRGDLLNGIADLSTVLLFGLLAMSVLKTQTKFFQSSSEANSLNKLRFLQESTF